MAGRVACKTCGWLVGNDARRAQQRDSGKVSNDGSGGGGEWVR